MNLNFRYKMSVTLHTSLGDLKLGMYNPMLKKPCASLDPLPSPIPLRDYPGDLGLPDELRPLGPGLQDPKITLDT